MHVLKPLELAYSPGSHAEQDVDSELAECVPGTHCVQEVDPVDGAEDPTGQTAQSAAPSAPSVEVPLGQFSHTLGRVARTAEEYLPRPHSKHSEPATGLYEPGEQSVPGGVRGGEGEGVKVLGHQVFDEENAGLILRHMCEQRGRRDAYVCDDGDKCAL